MARALLADDAERDEAVARTLEWLDDAQPAQPRHLFLLSDSGYPARLLDLSDPPLLLFGLGDQKLMHRAQLALIGSRNATALGARTASDFAEELARAGWVITSGFAEGIDQAAHSGALAVAEGGRTIAVIGTGIDRVYPAHAHALAHRIAEEGLILSELPLGSPALAQHFPRRNRLIAALAHGVLVVEAAMRSGSLITARLAAELGREVLAIPGSIHSPVARGCNGLIRQGARLVESVEDIAQEFPGFDWPPLYGQAGWASSATGRSSDPEARRAAQEDERREARGGDRQTRAPRPTQTQQRERSAAAPRALVAPLEGDALRLHEALDATPTTPERLANHLDLPIGRVLVALQQLENGGCVGVEPDGRCFRIQ